MRTGGSSEADRRAWAVGEMLRTHPHVPRAVAEQVYDRVASRLPPASPRNALSPGPRRGRRRLRRRAADRPRGLVDTIGVTLASLGIATAGVAFALRAITLL